MIGWRSGYITAVISSIGLHLLVVAAFLIDWPSESKDIVVQPKFIQAELIQLKPKEKPKKKAKKDKIKDQEFYNDALNRDVDLKKQA